MDKLIGLGFVVTLAFGYAGLTMTPRHVVAWDAARRESHAHVTVLPTMHIVGHVSAEPATLASR